MPTSTSSKASHTDVCPTPTPLNYISDPFLACPSPFQTKLVTITNQRSRQWQAIRTFKASDPISPNLIKQVINMINQWRQRQPGTELWTPEQLGWLFTCSTALSIAKSIPAAENSPTRHYQRVVLNIMIKNESNLLSRCLTSMLPLVDAVAITDTGSTDNSLHVVNSTLPKSLPLDIEIHPWQNFGYNRTEGLKQTRRFVERLGWPLHQTYILLIDADMVLRYNDTFHVDQFKRFLPCCDNWLVEQVNINIRYFNTRIIRASIPFVVIGRTHEYYSGPGAEVVGKIDQIWIDDLSDGNNKSDKFQRDEKLLLQDLEDNPKNARAMFYLAETYRHQQHFEKALEYYQKHQAMGSWEEEQWYSIYCVGLCYELMKDWNKAVSAFLAAYQRRPTRMEPIFHVAQYYHSINQQQLAYIFFELCARCNYPEGDTLFVEKKLYSDHKVDFELAILAYYNRMMNIGRKAIERLLRRRDLPSDQHFLVSQNARYYLLQHPHLVHTHEIVSPFQDSDSSISTKYVPCNPSLVMNHQDKLIVCCRGVNYRQKAARNYVSCDDDKCIRTRNVLIEMEPESSISPCLSPSPLSPLCSQKEILSHGLTFPCTSGCIILGLEDVRLFQWRGRLMFSCTSLEFHESHHPRICLGTLADDEHTLLSVELLTGYHDDKVQKNWLPFVFEDNLYFLYSYDPWVVLKFDSETRKVARYEPWCFDQTSIALQDMRGSSGPLPLPSGEWLICTHKVHDTEKERRYMHRWLWTDSQFRIKHVSPLFYFRHNQGVEMNIGACLSSSSSLVYVGVGVEDCQAFVLTYQLSNILSFCQTSVDHVEK